MKRAAEVACRESEEAAPGWILEEWSLERLFAVMMSFAWVEFQAPVLRPPSLALEAAIPALRPWA